MTPDSRRYHRVRGQLRAERRFNISSSQSTPQIERPFGNLPNRIANQLYRQTERPYIQGLGMGGGQGPEAGLLNYLTGSPTGGAGGGFLGSLYPGLQGIGQDAASSGTQAFNQLQGQTDQFLSSLPQFQALAGQGAQGALQGLGAAQQALGVAGQGAGYAGQFAQQQFDPQSQNQLYQQSAQRLLQSMRPGEAARGMEMQGAGGDAESAALRNLSFQQAQQQTGNQSQAIQNMLAASGQLGQAAGGLGTAGGNILQAALGQAGLGQMGMGAAANLLGQIPGLEQLQASQYGLPFQGIQDYLGLLGFGQQGAGNLLGATAPVVANTSTSSGFGIL